MTVLDVPNYIYYAGDGGTTSFPFPYKFFDDAEINVYSITSTATTLLGAGYSISKTGSAPYDSCDIVMTAAPASGTTLYIERICDISQEVDLPTGGAFRESVIEGALDKITMLCQQLDRDIGRGIKIPVALASSGADLDFPSPVSNYIIGWDAAGTALESKSVSSLGAVVTNTFTESFLSGVTDAQGMRDFSGVSTAAQILAVINADAHTQQINNLSFTVTASGTSLIVAFKDKDGNDPTAASPVGVSFRSGTSTASAETLVTLDAASSITLPSGVSVLGFGTNEAGRLYVYAVNNTGTLTPALARVGNLSESVPITTLDIDVAPSSTTQLYTSSALSNVPARCLGFIEVQLSGTTTWSNPPTCVQVMGPGVRRTGDIVQRVHNAVSAYATGSTVIPLDDTIPQITEGDQYMTQAITPTSAINKLRIAYHGWYTLPNAHSSVIGLFQDTTANALAATAMHGVNPIMASLVHIMTAGTTSATTFKIRIGGTSDSIQFNGWSGGRMFGGVSNNTLEIEEIFA